ncbi:MAG TPA: LptF/LptG family permease [Acidobacteriaceae bacterium]|jgi:LPS export ABC transporter permease LptG/LPS export ABC transporter permease LptF|nr:LptF/LptG family permease [Acidobacteriaceae bacterium]
MRLLTRYVLREVVSYALLGAVLFTFVLFMRDLPKILELVVRESASLTDVFRIFAYTLPNTLTFTIPTAVLAGILLGLSRLAADSEITAMRASGIGALSFVRIVSILSFAALGLGLLNTLYFAPKAAANLLKLEDQLKTSQVSFEVQPRVFFEDLKNYVLYVQDVRSAAGVATWHHVFLADLTQPANPIVITADEAIAFTPGKGAPQGLRLQLFNGGQQQISPTNPNSYPISTFTSTDLPLQFDSQDDTHISRVDTPLHALAFRNLVQRTHSTSPADARAARIELNSRFSYPLACLVLMLIGVPLGLSSKRGGKSTGVVLTLFLVFAYYLLSLIGDAFAKSGKLSPALGVWAANLIFTAFGILLLQQLAGTGILLHFFNSSAASLGRKLSHVAPASIRATLARFTSPTLPLASSPPAAELISPHPEDAPAAHTRTFHFAPTRLTLVQRMRSLFKTSFPLLLDEYVLRAYAANLLFSLVSFALLVTIFTFFELIGDIVRNGIVLLIVGDYLFNLVPYIVSAVTPLCSLLAVLITFGSLNRSSELTAMKATGISLYRVVAPIFVLAAILSVALFIFNESYLPDANRRQEALRAEIKGKPAQTFLRPDRKWISGQSGQQVPDASSATPAPERIFYYQAFDPYHKAFANLTVFEFDPKTFTLVRRIFATNAHWDDSSGNWVFDNGWQRTFANQTVASYQPFPSASFPEIHEQPSYFMKEDHQSQEMNYNELTAYIADLSQSGIDTIPLRVQLERKLADPAITLVMAILAVPFALSMGKRGSLAGVAIAIAVAISYWVVAGTFSELGNINTLPPLLAAWSPDLLFAIAGFYLLLRTPT